MEALKKSIAEKQAPPSSAAQAGPVAVPAGKKPPARAVQPVPAAQKRGKKVG
jgi:hypothetical protein